VIRFLFPLTIEQAVFEEALDIFGRPLMAKMAALTH
jgi:4-aminobutyrate aminotransferase-like enzyme